MSTYYADFKNKTKKTWTFGVFQKLPHGAGLVEVAWKQATAPENGEVGVSWDLQYNVVSANFQMVGGKGVYKASQILATDLGRKWEIAWDGKVQYLKEVGAAAFPDQILITNTSGKTAQPGFGMSGNAAVIKPDVPGNASASFIVKPKYYAALFTDLVVGEVISHNVVVGPIELTYPGGITHRSAVAYMEGQKIIFKVEEEGGFHSSVAVDLDTVEARIREIAELAARAAA